ncbi:MAG: hypothetical protein DRP27_03745 [Thermotogae bacterium]|nr:MAG: hypothetical protein DRP27_03745 [Thermotogota bacterium]
MILVSFVLLIGCTEVPMNTPPETKLVHADTLVGIHGGYLEVKGEDKESPANELHFLIEVDGVEMPMESNRFDLSNLEEGVHRIRVWTVDPQGAEDPSPVEITVRVDLTPPPRPLLSTKLVSSMLEVEILDYGIEEVDTEQLLITFDSSSVTTTYTDHFQLKLNKGEGKKTLSVVAIDAAGNPSPPATFVVDTDFDRPPNLFLEPKKFLSLDEAELALYVGDDWDATPLVFAEVDGERIEVGIDKVEIPSRISRGWHTLRISAEDSEGNENQVSRVFYFEKDRPPPPKLEIRGNLVRLEKQQKDVTVGLYNLGDDGELRFFNSLESDEAAFMPYGIVLGRSVSASGMRSTYSAPKVRPLTWLVPYDRAVLAAVTQDTVISSGTTVHVPGLAVTVPEDKTLVVEQGGLLALDQSARLVVKGTLMVRGAIVGGELLINGGRLIVDGAQMTGVNVKVVNGPLVSFNSAKLQGCEIEVIGVRFVIISETDFGGTVLNASSVDEYHMWQSEAAGVNLKGVGDAIVVESSLGSLTVSSLSKCEMSDSNLSGSLTVSGMSELYIRDSQLHTKKISVSMAAVLIVEKTWMDALELLVTRNARCVLRYNDVQAKLAVNLKDADLAFYHQARKEIEIRAAGGYRIFDHEP